MRRVLVLGASGMFGTAVERIFKESGLEVFGPGHSELDILDRSQLEKKIDEITPEAIVNSAVFMGIPACEDNPQRAFEINTVAALELARICKKRGIVLVQTSTNAIFDGKKGDLYVETDAPNPQNIYGLSKYAGEVGVRNTVPMHYIVRFPKLFGPRRNDTWIYRQDAC